jgi:hypothetical protein
MPGQTEQRKGGKNLTTSVHRKERYSFYKANVYSKNKLKRILQSCGKAFAKKWAMGHAALNILERIKK